ncbi:hypothetical protein DPMN_084076 [Dreissena polymorpha]|uniref:Uncharacterized protein n=1 Tax=Dreissena polymorpha TaxID=45954 RepID=A0A9D3YDQ2_DREPO|nr:hypothetical protein DPMN_084076 [Dreissena polymorpha]
MPKDDNHVFCYAVYICAVSKTGDKLYLTNPSQNKLLTLARDGSVLSSFTGRDLLWPTSVHVTPAGQVLVCGEGLHTIIQVDIKGREKLAILATQKDGLQNPLSVCFNSNTASIILSQWNKSQKLYNNKILVYKVQ